jgi:hypothetical protein
VDGDPLVHPKVSDDHHALTGVMQVAPVDVSMELFDTGESQGVKSEAVTVRTVNGCLYAIEESSSVSDYSWLSSAFVNENHPGVNALLKEALETDGVYSQHVRLLDQSMDFRNKSRGPSCRAS